DCETPSTSPSHCSASCAQSASSDRPTKPSSSRTRADIIPSTSPWPSSNATRTRGTPVYGPLRPPLAAGRCTPTARSAAGREGIDLGPEGGVFGNEFLIPLALDRRLRRGGDLANSLGVFQIRIDRGHDDSRLNRDQVDSDQRHADPGVDDDALVEHSI